MEILASKRLSAAKQSFATRRVNLDACKAIKTANHHPQAGELVLARVVELGSHKRIELPNGRKAVLQPGDEILLAYGNRYAPDQYEAYVPADLGPCHMVAAGGVAAKAVSWHQRLSGPTSVEPIGVLCGSDGNVLNLDNFSAPKVARKLPMATFAVFGSSMNAGKTITAASLVKGFADAGFKVGALKITGTAAGGDPWLMRDYGASEVFDFTDAGFATTFMEPVGEIVSASKNLLHMLGAAGCEIAVVEVADGLYQEETAILAAHPIIRSLVDGVFFAASDALGAVTGVEKLKQFGHTVLGVSGAVMRSPLGSREAANELDVPMLHLDELLNSQNAKALLDRLIANEAVAAE